MGSRRGTAAALFLGMSRFVRKERISRESKCNLAEKFCVNAITPIARRVKQDRADVLANVPLRSQRTNRAAIRNRTPLENFSLRRLHQSRAPVKQEHAR